MSKANVPSLTEKLFAKGVDKLAAACVRWPQHVGSLIVGDHPIRWHATETHADDVRSWLEARGYRLSGPVPSLYRRAVELETNLEPLLEQAEETGGVPAAAFAVGKAVVATNLEFTTQQPDTLRVTFGVGKQNLLATIGVHYPDEKVFVGANADVYLGRRLDVKEHERIRLSDLQRWSPDAHYL